jgi:hypothetical protein
VFVRERQVREGSEGSKQAMMELAGRLSNPEFLDALFSLRLKRPNRNR